jgi:DNA topoisomerase I
MVVGAPFIKYKGDNYKIPKGTEAKDLSIDECLKIVADQPASTPRRKAAAKPTAKKTPSANKAKKPTAKSKVKK